MNHLSKVLLGLMLGGSVMAHAQSRTCGSMAYLQHQIEQDPGRRSALEAIENHTNLVLASEAVPTGTITIPVVVHVVYNTSAENISAAQIQSQIDVLNQDFRRTNPDADGTWPQAADSEIEFCLASVDPNGNPTSGITRTSTSLSAFGTNDAVKSSASGGKDAWPSSQYLNMWVCDISGGILGYAQFPGGPASTDGVVIDYQYFGTIGTATAPFDLGRTTTHEVGHWLNLRHIWGDGGCSVDDGVSDTPVSDGPNYGCAPGTVSCGTTDMVQNYMDYSDDGCMNLFTAGQKARMRALFDTSGGARASLLSSGGCGGGSGGPTCSDGIQNGTETGVDCGGSCPPCPVACTDNPVTLSITLDNYPSETSWSLVNDAGVTVASGGGYSGAGSTVTQDLCLPDDCYTFTINDSYGDGICCAYGSGSYTLSGPSGVLASGGSFGSSESTPFCLGGGPAPTCTDGVQNGDETGVDCGGSACPPCATCTDGIQNGDETGVDCGGSACPPCATCTDGIQNGDETGVDCGGSACPPCPVGCTDNTVTLSITFDNYPEETAWSITNAGGATVASGGPYGSQPDGSTITEEFCVPDGCYTFTITDAYGDGICCAYGSGSYSLTGPSGTLASGGSFGASESTPFCLGGGPAPTCSDGIQNGDETGVDCGGSVCPPCGGGGGCTDVVLDANDFESTWGIWNDGGSDCAAGTAFSAFANSGSSCVRLRDNTSSSVMTTDVLDLSNVDELTVSFSYITNSMDNANEDFWLQISTNGGSSYTTVEEWNLGDEFVNNVRYNDAVTLTGPFGSNVRLRFRCDASANNDQVYLDDVVIEGCVNPARMAAEAPAQAPALQGIHLFPNPANDRVFVRVDLAEGSEVDLTVTDLAGQVVWAGSRTLEAGSQQLSLETASWTPGMYLLQVTDRRSAQVRRFVVSR